MARAGASPRTLTLAWVTLSVIWLLTAVGKAILLFFLQMREMSEAGNARAQDRRGRLAVGGGVQRIERGDAHRGGALAGDVALLLRVGGVVGGVGQGLGGGLIKVAQGHGGSIAENLDIGLGDAVGNLVIDRGRESHGSSEGCALDGPAMSARPDNAQASRPPED